MSQGDVRGRPELLRRIAAEIRSGGPIPFARFMELALYDARWGYYGEAARIGPGGDFFTAVDAGHAFGRCLARQLVEIDDALGPFDPFHVVELGAGRGLLARDVLDALHESAGGLAARLRYVLADRSAAMRREALRRVPEARVVVPEELGEGAAYRGCVVAVELFDALPVHRVRRREGRLVEVLVGIGEHGDLVEVEGPPGPEVARLAERYGAASAEGSEAEVCCALEDELRRMGAMLERGVLVVVDYGDRAERLYGPARPRGTLLAYHRHQTAEAYLERVGEQDLTAHVNFTALEDAGRAAGFDFLGLTTQDRFLIANGILEEFACSDVEQSRDPERLRRRLRAMPLIHPGAMGRAFKVALLSKGCPIPPRLAGLQDPFARGRVRGR